MTFIIIINFYNKYLPVIVRADVPHEEAYDMKDSLQQGLTSEFTFTVPENKTVPFLFPEAPEFQVMPRVLATGFMVGLFEWACIKAINPHLDWPREQTVGTDVRLSHCAATPPGLTVTVQVRLERVEGRRLFFSITGHDGVDIISEGTHERYVIDSGKFSERVRMKAGALNKTIRE
jgi:fluoroacetyl-CoA thioesterase